MDKKIKTTSDLLEEISDLKPLDTDNDPVFISDYTKGKIVEDILKIMDEKGITKTELSNRIGKSRQYVSRVLNEKVNFTIDTLSLFSCALGCFLSVKISDRGKNTENRSDPCNTVKFPDNIHENLPGKSCLPNLEEL